MSWELVEELEDKDGVKEWSLYILMTGDQRPSSTTRPFIHGYWFFGIDDGDPAGHELYKEGLKKAKAEVDRLNRLLGRSPRR